MNVSIEILREQLSNTIVLNAHVQHAAMHFRNRHKPVAELLSSLSRELRAVSALLNGRGAAVGATSLHIDAVESSNEGRDDEVNLDALLNRFCDYAKATESGRALAEKGKDMDTVRLLDQILSLVNDAVWFLDVYSNALAVKCALTLLPAWRPMPGAVHRVA
jgi:DNA-binding ferritin-like protein